MVIDKNVLLSKKQEYITKLQMYRNTAIAIEGAIDAIDDLLKDFEDAALTTDELKEAIGAQSVEVMNDKS
jgi:uncharacterized protein YutE (UPF0331/DUF86 family)